MFYPCKISCEVCEVRVFIVRFVGTVDVKHHSSVQSVDLSWLLPK